MYKQNASNKSSYLTFDESSAIKGLLMLLIILGHNHILAPIGGLLFEYLYSFHIFGFFILPFLYNKKIQFDKAKIINTIVRNWIPYIFFFVICYFIYHVITLKGKGIGFDFFYGLTNGSPGITKQIAGFYYLWFMPAYAAMSIVVLIFDNSKRYIQILILLIGLVLYYFSGFTFNQLYPTVPFAITQGFYYFMFGFLTKLLLDKVPYSQYLGAIAFVVITALYWINRLANVYYLFPISGFLFVYTFSHWLVKVKLLVFIGNYSFPVYLLHVIVYNFLGIILPKTLLFGYIDLVLTVLISMILAYFMIKIDFVRKLILPKDWQDVKSLFTN